jgi:hypothetical protein
VKEHHDRVADVKGPIIVCVRGIEAPRGPASCEEVAEDEDGISDVNVGVGIGVTAAERATITFAGAAERLAPEAQGVVALAVVRVHDDVD